MFFTDRSKAVHLLWIIFVIYVSCVSCFLVCSLQPCGHLLEKGKPLGSLVCNVLLCGVLGQVWYLIVSISDICLLTYFVSSLAFNNAGLTSSVKIRKKHPNLFLCACNPDKRSRSSSQNSVACIWMLMSVAEIASLRSNHSDLPALRSSHLDSFS